jgi:hypothetical protein
LFGGRVASPELSRRRTELAGFADELELRDFLKANHPVAVAMYREAGDDPEAVELLDDAFLGTINLWYGRNGDESSGSFVQEAVFIVARKRSVALAW